MFYEGWKKLVQTCCRKISATDMCIGRQNMMGKATHHRTIIYVHTYLKKEVVCFVGTVFLRNQTLPDLVLLVYLKDDSRFGFTNNYCICICGLWIILIPL